MAFSDDDGTSYTPAQGGGAPAGPDHETVGGGPFNPNATPAPPAHPLYPHAVYYASQNIVGDAEVSRSDDGGLTFGPSVLLFNPTQCVGESTVISKSLQMALSTYRTHRAVLVAAQTESQSQLITALPGLPTQCQAVRVVSIDRWV